MAKLLKLNGILFLLIIAAPNSNATTIWCKQLNIGCPTHEEIKKAIENCHTLAKQTKEKALIEALAEPSIWRLHGSTSAEDYSIMRQNTMMSICLKKSPDLRN
jgi:hypothetical protein